MLCKQYAALDSLGVVAQAAGQGREEAHFAQGCPQASLVSLCNCCRLSLVSAGSHANSVLSVISP